MTRRDTIYALATPAGRGAVAIVRISGPGAAAVRDRLIKRPLVERQASRVNVIGEGGEILDDALAIWFEKPRSYTGEDILELHLHGGRAVVEGVITAVGQVADVRPADAGEFTRRAFLEGKLDLTEAEGIADLIAADTAAQRRMALRQWGGELQRSCDRWRGEVVKALAYFEAALDFSDEDIPDDVWQRGFHALEATAREIEAVLQDGRRGERIRDGISVVISGAPNVGKSTLFNALVGREKAIVSAIPGTTRDVLEAHLDVDGYAVVLADTAGVRETGDEIEREGVRRAEETVKAADITIVVMDGQEWREASSGAVLLKNEKRTIGVINKSDLTASSIWVKAERSGWIRVSAKTGEGMTILWQRLKTMISTEFHVGEASIITRERHRIVLQEAHAAMQRLVNCENIEEAAEETRLAGAWLGRLTGRIEIDEVLDRVFREFCIGK